MHTPEIVLLGGPDSGKTHFAGQLYGRLKRNPSLLELRDTPADLSALEEVLLCLENGHAAGHTSAGTWTDVLLPLKDNRGNELDLRWPDYGGEQLRTIFTERQVTETWRSELRQADGWLLLIRLNKEITYPELQKELAKIGANLLLETIPKWIKGAIKPKAQDESAASYTKILTKKDGKVDWRKSADEIEKQIRAYSPWPGSWTFWQIIRENLLRVKILKADVFKSHDEKVYPIGKVLVVPQNEPGIQCGKDFLVIKKLQLDGKKPMNSEEFLRGHPDFIGIILK